MRLRDFVVTCLLYCLFLHLIALHRALPIDYYKLLEQIENSFMDDVRDMGEGWMAFESDPLTSTDGMPLEEISQKEFFSMYYPNESSPYKWELPSEEAVLSSSLALSLLRHSVSPSETFVFSPYSLDTALSIVHDGASGNTQKELTNLLLNGSTPAQVTDFYSSLFHSIHSANDTGVAFKSANRFYVNNSISLLDDYQRHVEEKFRVQVDGIDFRQRENAAKIMNEFVEEATNGKIKDMIKTDSIEYDTAAILINAVHFLGQWKNPFDPKSTHKEIFHGSEGDRKMDFMNKWDHFRVNFVLDFASALMLPYQDDNFNFFYLLPCDSRRQRHCKLSLTLEEMRNDLTGERLVNILREAKPTDTLINVPKFTVESEMDAKKILSKMGVKQLFTEYADLSKISDDRLYVSDIHHKATIEVDEQGVEAAAATEIRFMIECTHGGPAYLTVDRPFLFGIMRGDHILFLGQYA